MGVERAIVVGAGPGGLTAALALRAAGVEVTVLERAPALVVAGAGITVQVNAMRALDCLGVAEPVIAAGCRLTVGTIADGRGRPLSALPFDTGRWKVPGVAIHRAALSAVLFDALPAGTVRFDAPVDAVDRDGAVRLEGGEVLQADLVVGADGIGSRVREAVSPGVKPIYAGYTCWRGVAVDTANPRGRVEERWGTGQRFGIVPIGPDTTYWFATENAPPGGHDGDDPIAEARARFAGFGDPVPALLEGTEAVLRNDILELPTLPRWTAGKVALIGDAAHAMTPNMGQGACQAIEDAVLLADRVNRGDPAQGLAAWEAERRRRVLPIVARSRVFGAIGQWENPVGRWLRDTLTWLTPAAATRAGFEPIYGVALPDRREVAS